MRGVLEGSSVLLSCGMEIITDAPVPIWWEVELAPLAIEERMSAADIRKLKTKAEEMFDEAVATYAGTKERIAVLYHGLHRCSCPNI
jgi:hypothetical protein